MCFLKTYDRLLSIHPFVDGNGRTARLVMNLLLMQHGYPPAIILRTDRQAYYRVLSLADNGREKPLVNFVGRAAERSLMFYLEAAGTQVEKPKKEETWLSLAEAAQATPYSQEYLSLLARLGRIEAAKRGRNWFTTRKAVRQYMDTIKRKKR
ncbi:MAG: hypothetical protein DPW18_07230 [Chloroflexi bacterium]|nr:hypothetical protein [Chloroflexota bacterium]MDL1942352.1 hypothetical protein [Chloroflexi bacterium CFX2]